MVASGVQLSAISAVAGLVVAIGWLFPRLPSGSQYTGDAATVSPCTFAGAAERSLSEVGSVNIDPHADNFNKCDLLLKPTDGQSEIDVKFSLEYRTPRTTPRHRQRPSEYELNISIPSGDSRKNPSLCPITDTATRAVTKFLNEGGEFQFRNPNDQTSLIHVNACGLLDVSTLTRFELVTAGEPDLWNWLCRWGSDGDLDVSIRFDQGEPNSVKLESFGRFSGYLKPHGDDANNDNCLAVIRYRQLPAANSHPEYEMVRVAVYGERPLDAVCDVARQLAQDVAMNLT